MVASLRIKSQVSEVVVRLRPHKSSQNVTHTPEGCVTFETWAGLYVSRQPVKANKVSTAIETVLRRLVMRCRHVCAYLARIARGKFRVAGLETGVRPSTLCAVPKPFSAAPAGLPAPGWSKAFRLSGGALQSRQSATHIRDNTL